MRRILVFSAVFLAAVAALWLAGRTPPRAALEDLCARFQADRRDRARLILAEITRIHAEGGDVVRLAEARARLDELLNTTRDLEVRGWAVRLVPDSALPPPPLDFRIVGECEPWAPDDPAELRRAMEIQVAPRGFFARLWSGLGLTG